MYKPSITPEAAKDIVDFTFSNPTRKFKKAEIKTYLDGEEMKYMLHIFYSHVDYPEISHELSIPFENVIELLSFAMTTLSDAHELTEGYR